MDHALDAAPLPDISRAVWRCVDIRSDADLEAIIEKLAPLAKLDPLGGHERSPAWLAAASRDEDAGLMVFLLEVDQTLLGYAMAVTLQNSHWYLEAGSHSLSRISVDRFNSEGGPFLDPRLPAVSDDLVLGWLKLLRERCTNRTLVGSICVPADSPLVAAAKSGVLRSAGYRLMPYGAPGLRRIMTLPHSFDDYIKSLGRSTRQTLSRRHRKLVEEHDVALEIASAAGDVEGMLEGALEVSKKTYQWESGIGLNETDRYRRGMTAAAKAGCLRWYLLRCDGQPVAFMSGYLSGDRFIWPDLGFDPDWSEKAAGLVLQYLVIEDLIENAPTVRRYDCGTRDSENKRRFVKSVEQEHDLFFIPTTPFGTALFGAASAVNGGIALAKLSLAGRRRAAALTRRIAGAVRPSPLVNAPPAAAAVQVTVHEDLAALPAAAKALLEEAGKHRFMNGYHWYQTFAATCLDAGQSPRFYVIASKDAPKTLLIMPMITPLGRAGSRISARKLGEHSLMAMTNHQSRSFAPISNADPECLERLLQGFAIHLKQEGCSTVDVNHLDPEIADAALLGRAFTAAGFSVAPYHDQTVVFDRLEGRSFAEFLKGLSSNLRSNLNRRRKKLEKMGALRFEVVQGGDGLAKAIQDYEAVQKTSWKPDEIYPRHVSTLILAAAEAGSLRLGILYLDDRPVAADLSFVSDGFAYSHKGHFDEAFRQHGAGDVMTLMALERLIDDDKVDIVDFGKNADPYKLKWLKRQGSLGGLVAFDTRTLDGQLQRLIYRTRIGADAHLSGLKRRFQGSKLEATVKAVRGRSSKA